MRLGIDLDGVVADFNSGWMAVYNREFGSDLRPEWVESWDGLVPLTHFPDMEAFWDWASGSDERHSIFRYLKPYHDAIPAMERLAIRNDIVILTQKPGWAIHDTFAWIADHRIPTREVHMTHRKWRVPCDVYLDDAPHQIRAIHRHRPEAAVVRFVRAWNEPTPGVHDVDSWNDFVNLIDTLGEDRTD
jgi:5'(3')-deoxyribonucleotidase